MDGDRQSSLTLSDLVEGKTEAQKQIEIEVGKRRAQLEREIAGRRESIRRSQVPLGMKASDVAARLLEGMAEGAYASGIGLSNLVGAKKTARKIENARDEARDAVGESDSVIGTASGVLGRLGYEGAEFMMPGSALKKVSQVKKLGKVADYAKKGYDALFPKGAGFVRRVAGNVALSAPLDVVKAQDPESSTAQALADATDSPLLDKVASTKTGRSAVEVGADIVGQGLFEGGAHVVGQARAKLKARRAVKAAEAKGNVPRLEKGAYEMGEPTVSPTPEPDVETELYPQIEERRRLLSGEPKLLPARSSASTIDLPGEVSPAAKLAAAEREAMLSSARKTAANPPSSEEVVNRVLSNKDAETEAAMEKEITRRLNEVGVPRRSTPGQMIEEEIRAKYQGKTTAARSPLAAAQETLSSMPEAPTGAGESHPSMEQLSMLTPPKEKAAPKRYTRTPSPQLLGRAIELVDRLNEAAASPRYAARHRVKDDARILSEIEAELRGRGEIPDGETIESVAERHRERTAEQEGAALADDQADTSFDPSNPSARLAMGAGAVGAGAGSQDEDASKKQRTALGVAAALLAGGAAGSRVLRRARPAARAIGRTAVEMGDRASAIAREREILNAKAKPMEIPPPGGRAGTRAAMGAAGAGLAADTDEDSSNGKKAAAAALGMAVLPPRFYSRLLRAIEKAPFAKGTAEQWGAILGKGVSKGEREWTGVDRMLAANAGKVLTREQVQEAATKGLPRIQETTLTNDFARSLTVSPERSPSGRGRFWRVSNGRADVVIPAETAEGAREVASREYAEHLGRNAPTPKYGQYTEPGGDNYREILLKLDTRRPRLADFANRAEYDAALRARDAAGGADFDSGHFEPNVLVHVRAKDRTLPNGEKVLFVEEMQSDWHQKGRRQGYDTEEYRRRTAELQHRIDTLNREKSDLLHFDERLPGMSASQARDRLTAIHRELDPLIKEFAHQAPVPDAPFKKTEEWTGLAMKRLIDEAVDKGYDRIAWTTGDQQARRYDLSRHVDKIQYNPDGGALHAWKDGSSIHDGNYDVRALPDVIGKEAADNLLKTPRADNGYHTLEGEGLKVGGAGMRAYYDQMLPKWVRDYGKQLGVKIDVEPVAMQFGAEGEGGAWRRGPGSAVQGDPNAITIDELAATRNALEDTDSDDPGMREALASMKAVAARMRNHGQTFPQAMATVTPETRQAVADILDIEFVPEARKTWRGRPGSEMWQTHPEPDIDDIEDFRSTIYNDIGPGSVDPDHATWRDFDLPLRRIQKEMERGARFDDAFNALPDADRGRLAERMEIEQTEVGGAGTQHSFKITPELKAKVQGEGQPMWAAGGAAAASAAGSDDEDQDESIFAKPGVLLALGIGGAYGYRAARRGAFTHFIPPIISKAAKNAQKARIRPQDVNVHEFVNVAKFALDPSGEKRLEQVVQRVVSEKGMAPKQRVSWDATKRMAAKIGLDPSRLTEKHAGRLSGPEMLAIRNLVQGNIRTIEEIGRHLADPALTDERRATLEQALDMIDHQNDQLIGRFVQERSQTGRDLNNLKILAKNSLDPTLWFSRAKRLLGERPLTSEHRTEILKLVNAEDRNGLAAYVAKLREPTAIEKIVTVWKAGLLTAIPTHLANLAGNTAMAALETAKDVPAAVVDAMLGALTGERTKAVSSIGASWKGAQEGAREALRVLKTGQADGVRRWDAREIDFDSPILNTYTKAVFRSLDASDRVFRGMALQRSLDEQARAAAKNEGLKGSAYAARVRQLLLQPSDQMTLQAIADAELATFRNQGALARAGGAVRRALGKPSEFVLPFTTTPGNIAERVVEYTPIGSVAAFSEMLYKAGMGRLDRATQRKLADRLGRGAIGILPIIGGYMLAEKGLMTAGRPKRPSEQQEHDLEGKQENAVLVGGKWRSVERVSPFGNLLIFGAHLHRVVNNPDMSVLGKIVGAASSVGQTVVESSFLQGVDQLTEILKGDEEGADKSAVDRFAQSMAGSIVPAGVARAARAMDPTARQTEGAADAIKARIPGASRMLPAKVDQLGRDVEAPSGIAALVDPTNARSDRTIDDPTVRELARVGAIVGRLKRDGGEGVRNYTQRARTYGRILQLALDATIQSNEYRQIPAIAQALVEKDPRFAGRDASVLGRELQKGHLEDVVKNVRRQLTIARKAS